MASKGSCVPVLGRDKAALLVQGRMSTVEDLLERCLINCRQVRGAAGEESVVHPELMVDMAGVLFERLEDAAHLLCPRCRKVEAQPKGVRVHVVDEASVARMRCRVTTLCGRNADNVRTEGIITCGRCLEIMRLRARDAAYRRALAIVSDSAMAQAHFALDEISRSGFEQIAQELRLRADGQLPARLVGPVNLERAVNRKNKVKGDRYGD